MARFLLACMLLASASAQSRWSRQISSYTADTSEWVPLTAPLAAPDTPEIKRQAVAEPRILAEPYSGFNRPAAFNQDFGSRNYYQPNRPLYLQSVPSVPSAPQNFLTDQGFGQSIRFGLSQPNFPLNQGFISPQFNYDTVPQMKPRPTVPTNPIKFESFPKTLPSNQAKPFINQAPKKQAPKFVDGYRLENVSKDFTFNQKKPQSLQKLKFDAPKTETLVPNKSQLDREEVQLLYVPVESLNRGQFSFRSPLTAPQILGNPDLYSQGLPKASPSKQVFTNDYHRPAQSVESTHFGQEYYNYNSQYNDQVPKFSTIQTPFPTAPPTTPRPKKLKPHQPPLAVFLSYEARKGAQVKVGDVLTSLKNANTIAVLDAVNPLNAPKVFIGPSTLTPPENYVKFELPYLSNIENSDKKLKQLPFFVAPLSYNTPNGFAKIPFPSPHVGSVVINSQIKDTPSTTVATPAADVIPNSYIASPPSRSKEPVTQKPNFSYYSTASPKTNAPSRQSEYYSFEPQTVTSIRPPQKDSSEGIITAPPKTGSYFLSNVGSQYTSQEHVNFPSDNNYNQEQVKSYVVKQQETTTRTPKTTSKPAPTYPSQLLETHNPYSINQAFHFSTPLDYNSYLEENKDYQQQQQQQEKSPQQASASTSSASPSTTRKPEVVTERQTYQQQSSPNYLQNYSPEIHYEAENPSPRYPTYDSNEYTTKPTNNYQYLPESNGNNVATFSSANPPTNTQYVETQPPVQENFNRYEVSTASVANAQPTRSPSYDEYETSYNSNESKETSTTTTSTTTTTTRKPLRARGRPRYTTPKTESQESSSKATVTRRPLRERRPPASRPRYEPNKITTEKPTRKPVDSNESSTKSSIHSRTRQRGRVQFKPSDGDGYSKSKEGSSASKEDLAYQRDILHQNYPVTLMERMSTVDVEALTEPTTKFSSTKNVDTTYDTDNAYTYERASVSQLNANSNENTYSTRSQVRTEAPYVPHVPSTREEYAYHSRSSLAPVEAIAYDETSPENEESYVKQTTPVQKESAEVAYATEPTSPATETPSYTVSIKQGESVPQEDDAKFLSQEVSHETEQEVQTTPSYNRVRVRPGVIRQYHQSTEAPKKERKRPVQAVTYRPAFDRRRTTMRIEEIGEDLKTKQVHARPEVGEHRHPVYKPEPTTEPSITSGSQESTTKRNQFRRKRPYYTTTSTESSSTKKTYEVKNRFRGRRPTDRPTDKPEAQTDATTTARNTVHSRYSPRPRLSERYNKKPEVEESEDQEPNYSINRPKFAEPDSDSWSPKISTDSFKPYNPNDIVNERKDSLPAQENEESEMDIITARNEYDDILISVTPATNRLNKKIPDIPPTLEALVEQSKVTNSDSPDAMSTFETMLEEVMKSLEEQDQDEYTSSVMKHKGGEIGEIPPERIISSGDYQKTTTDETTTVEPSGDGASIQDEDEKDRKGHRRGFWKKVKVRPATTEAIEAAESQYYSHTVNRLGDPVKPAKTTHDKGENIDKPHKVTTYKPAFNIKDIFDEETEALPTVEIPKTNPTESKETTESIVQTTPTEMSPGDMDLGTGSPDPTVEMITTTEAAKITDRSDGFSFMDYLFGATASDDVENKSDAKSAEVEITTEPTKPRIATTESNIIPDEITAIPDEDILDVTEFTEIKKSNVTEITTTEKSETTESPVSIESSSVSSFMNPANVVSTSMSTEVSHETEICFRGKCIKTSRDLL